MLNVHREMKSFNFFFSQWLPFQHAELVGHTVLYAQTHMHCAPTVCISDFDTLSEHLTYGVRSTEFELLLLLLEFCLNYFQWRTEP